MKYWVIILLAMNLVQAGYYSYVHWWGSPVQQQATLATAPSPSELPIQEKTDTPKLVPAGQPLCDVVINDIRQQHADYSASIVVNNKIHVLQEGQAISPLVTLNSISSQGVYLHYREFEQFVAFKPVKKQQSVDVENIDEGIASVAFPEAERVKLFDASRIATRFQKDINVVSANVFEVRRDLFSEFIKSRKDLKSVGFAVSSKGGFQATRVEEDGLFASLGLETGDIVKTINHHELNNISDVIEVYGEMEKYESIELSLERQGQKIYYYYNMFE